MIDQMLTNFTAKLPCFIKNSYGLMRHNYLGLSTAKVELFNYIFIH